MTDAEMLERIEEAMKLMDEAAKLLEEGRDSLSASLTEMEADR